MEQTFEPFGLSLPDPGPGLVRYDSEPTIAAAALAFEIVSAGVSAAMQGDIEYNGPTGDVGVRVESGRPAWLRSGTSTKHLEIFRYYRTNGWPGPLETVTANVKLIATAQWNGLEVDCSFNIPADGNRSRMGTDTKINIGNPLSLLELDAPQSWKNLNPPINKYPVVFVPVSIFVDEPWPNSNYKESFWLTLSGMYGFGAPGYSTYEHLVQHSD